MSSFLEAEAFSRNVHDFDPKSTRHLHIYLYCAVIPGLISDFYLTYFNKYISVSTETRGDLCSETKPITHVRRCAKKNGILPFFPFPKHEVYIVVLSMSKGGTLTENKAGLRSAACFWPMNHICYEYVGFFVFRLIFKVLLFGLNVNNPSLVLVYNDVHLTYL